MMRALSTSVSGLKNSQAKMDVIGNNIANVNTIGFKSSRVTFKESFAELVKASSRPSAELGGTDPAQVGLGADIASIQTRYQQGSFESTGINTDLAISGDSLFVVSDGGGKRLFTRAGNFRLDANGYLVSPNNGFRVQGRAAVNGVAGGPVVDVRIPLGTKVAPKPTANVTMRGNLDPSKPVGAASTTETSLFVYDDMGVQHSLKVVTTKTGVGAWQWDAYLDGGAASVGTGPITFNAQGQVATPAPGAMPVINIPAATVGTGAGAMAVKLDFGAGLSGITQTAGENSPVLRDQDGYGAGQLDSYSIDVTGTITGAFSNGTSQVLGQIAVADFNNAAGLQRAGDSMFMESPNSGGAVIDYAGGGSRATITSGALEQSNVDLAQEFTDMITTQRGYSANGRIVSTAAEMLQELVSLGR